MNRRNPSGVSAGLLTLVFAAGALASGICHAQKYSVIRLHLLPGGTYTSGAAMNNAGTVVGSADDANGDSVAVQWNGSTPTVIYAIDPEFGGAADAVAINNSGVAIGDDYFFEPGIFVIGPGVDSEQAFDHGIAVGAISDDGVVVGTLEGHPSVWFGNDVSQFPSFGLPTTPGNYGTASTPSGVNDAHVVVGTETDYPADSEDSVSLAVRWKPDPVTRVPGATVEALKGLGGANSSATAINGKGWIVGWATLGNQRQHAALWEPSTGAYDLGTLGGHESTAAGINAEGDIAGAAQTASGVWHAVLWTHKHFVATDLNLLISPSLAAQVTLTSAVATNDRCMVLANGVDKKSGAQATYVLSLTVQSQCNAP